MLKHVYRPFLGIMSDYINNDILDLHLDKAMEAINTMGSNQESFILLEDAPGEKIDLFQGISKSNWDHLTLLQII